MEKKNVIGVPGCAKSPLRNGFDEVLEKTCYGIRLDKKKISSMSNGGLFKNSIKKKNPAMNPMTLKETLEDSNVLSNFRYHLNEIEVEMHLL